MTPDLELMRQYGNESLYLEKQAGAGAFVARVGMALLAMKMIDSFHQNVGAHRFASEMQSEGMRAPSPEMQDVNMRMRYTRSPVMVAASGVLRTPEQIENNYQMGVLPSVPVGMDQGMVRMASAMSDLGREMAKEALGLKGSLGVLAAGAGVGLAAHKGGKAVTGVLAQENRPTDWGHVQAGAPQLAYGVNEHGYAQRGTPFSG